jgi:hypothetical protein
MLVSNIRPLRMSLEQLQSGMRWLLNRVFSPRAFGDRVEAFAKLCASTASLGTILSVSRSEIAIARHIASMGYEELQLVRRLERILQNRPDLHSRLLYVMLGYAQIRYLLNKAGVWNPQLAQQDSNGTSDLSSSTGSTGNLLSAATISC